MSSLEIKTNFYFSALREQILVVDDNELLVGGEPASGGAHGPQRGRRWWISDSGRRPDNCKVRAVLKIYYCFAPNLILQVFLK